MPKKPEPFRFNQLTKAELIKTIKTLDRRQVKLLNEVARLQRIVDGFTHPTPCDVSFTKVVAERWPWEQTK